MRPRAAPLRLSAATFRVSGLALVLLSLQCGAELQGYDPPEAPLSLRPAAGTATERGPSSNLHLDEEGPGRAPPPARSSPEAHDDVIVKQDLAPLPTSVAVNARPRDEAVAAGEARCGTGEDESLPAPRFPRVPRGRNVPVAGDTPLYVLDGSPKDPRVIVYLHGMCGDIAAPDDFRDAAAAHGTLVALRGERPCGNGRYKWSQDLALTEARIERALEVMKAESAGALDTAEVVIFGYSQGATRAEALAERAPRRFSRVVLGGPPLPSSPRKLGRSLAVAIIGGELETKHTMRLGYERLRAAGLRTRFFTLECAHHGEYGTRANEQLGELFDWLMGGKPVRAAVAAPSPPPVRTKNPG